MKQEPITFSYSRILFRHFFRTWPIVDAEVEITETGSRWVQGVRVQVDSSISIEFNPQDLWVGLFWKKMRGPFPASIRGAHVLVIDFYLCLIPCLVLHVAWGRAKTGDLRRATPIR